VLFCLPGLVWLSVLVHWENGREMKVRSVKSEV